MTDFEKLNNFNNINRMERGKEEIAYNMGKIAHAFEARKSGEPYFEGHSVKVADIILKKWFDDKNFEKLNSDMAKKVMGASYLHDTVEDTILTNNWIVEIFGDEMAEIIDSLTENEDLRKLHEKNMDLWKDQEYPSVKEEKKDMKIYMLKNSLKKIEKLKNSENKDAWEIAATVRLADIIQNLSDYDFETGDKKKIKLQERNLEKSEIIFKEFDGKIDLAETLKERIEGIKIKLEIKSDL